MSRHGRQRPTHRAHRVRAAAADAAARKTMARCVQILVFSATLLLIGNFLQSQQHAPYSSPPAHVAAQNAPTFWQ